MDPIQVVSALEERFERTRRTVGLFLGPAVLLLLYHLPMPDLSHEAHTLAAILGLVVTWWVTEPIPIAMTSVLGAVLVVLLGVAPAAQAFAPFADPTVFLFLGSFMLARAMTVHGLDRRFARGILSLAWVNRSSTRVLLAFGLIAALLSAWASNTATTAMLFPIGLGIAGSMAEALSADRGAAVDPRALRFGTSIMLMAAYAASVGGIATPVGTPPNLIGIALIEKATGVHVSFFQWMALGFPMVLVMFAFLFGMLRWMHPPERARLELPRPAAEPALPWSRGELNTLVVFLVTVALWLLPAAAAAIYGPASPQAKSWNAFLPEGGIL